MGSLADSYCKCLVTNLFKACIEAGQARLAKQLLALGLFDVNTIVCLFEEKKYTALELASKLRHLELVKALVKFKADPNKSFQHEWWWCGALGALIVDIRRESTTAASSVIQDIARELLQAGAKVNAEIIGSVINQLHAADLAQALMERLMKTTHDISILQEALPLYAGEVEEVHVCKALDNFHATYNEKSQMETGFHRPCSKEFQYAIVESAKRGHVQTVRKYADFVGSRTMLLCGAFRSRRRDMIDLLSREAMDVNTVVYIDPDYGCSLRNGCPGGDPSTPFAEAILTGDDHLITLCVDAYHALDTLPCGLQFQLTIDAAASVGNAGLVQRILDQKLHPRPLDLYAALLHAVERGYNSIAHLLLSSGAALWQSSRSRPSPPDPLLAAILQRNIPMARTILELGGTIFNIYRPPGCETSTTLLAETIRLGDRDLILLVRDCLPYIFVSSDGFDDGLGAALAECDDDTLQFLLLNQVLEKHQLTSGLRFAAEKGDLTVAREMLELGATPREDCSILSKAAVSNPEILVLVLGHISQSKAPLWSYEDRFHILQDFPWGTTNGLTSLEYLLDTGLFNSHERYRLQCGERFTLLPDGYSILGLSIMKSDIEPESGALTVQMLLDMGFDPNQIAGDCFDGHKTPLLLAIEKKSKRLVEMLLDARSEVNTPAPMRLGRTPLQKAAELGCLDIVNLLLSRGAEVNAEPALRGGGTALQLAALSGNINVAHELLKKNADLHAKPKALGRWPLEGAAEHGRADMVDYLWRVSCGGFNDNICKGAMHLAMENGHEPVKELIEGLMRHREMFPFGPC
ncbi:ankyrin repeats (3 copies) domain-containing protein [Sarocladium implicatum]|nr:ankyrin repeats (3 copies) domain-containing protein [Sarocladium implicatum]